MPVGYVFDSIYLEHDTGDHPENAKRLRATMNHLINTGLIHKLVGIRAEPATLEDLERIHTPAHIENIRRLASGGMNYIELDTVVSTHSYEAAVYAAGGTIAATKAVLSDQVESAYALVRPPGHHAVRTQAMGFCLFNNIAIAAAWALAQGGVSRVAIIDFDVHHGNGVQAAFETRPDVLYVSTHQHPFYPGTGFWREEGIGAGKGTCLNIPLPPETGDLGYRQAFRRLIEPKVRRFQPDLILVSAGYDAHWADPLAWMLLSLGGYRQIADSIVGLARELCGGRMVVTLEGGYELAVLAFGVEATFTAMLGLPFEDRLGPANEPETNVEALLARIAQWHGLS
ncbi:MAG: histone deacetylase [Anaerolineae bacterium]|nr:histone deacetylase [Anaerolineae bacterium]